MPRTTRPLTNTEVSQAKPKAKEYNLCDGKGLSLRVKPSGSKHWLFNYTKPFTKVRANISFGMFPDLSLANARAKRDENLKLLAQDIDPKEHKNEQVKRLQNANELTFEHVAEKWLTLKRKAVTPDHATDIQRSLEKHMFPSLGKMPIHKLTAPTVIEVLEPVSAKGSLETVKRLIQRINEIMTFAVNTGLTENNPLAGITKAFESPKKIHMLTLKPEELPELIHTLNTASLKLITKCVIEWQLHTMVRPGEAAGAAWSEIDFEKALWNIPAERMKKKKAHTVPLTPQSLAILEVMKPISGHRQYIFTSDKNPQKHIHEQTANAALKRIGYKNRLVAHGLRSIASTTLNAHGFEPDLIEAALAHVSNNEVRNAYNRTDYLERRKKLMLWWSEHIENAAIGNMSVSSNIKKLRIIN